MKNWLKINDRDNVVVLLDDMNAGAVIEMDGLPDLVIKEQINRGHKIAVRDIRKGEALIKYGYPIGHAGDDIEAGMHVHTHNLRTALEGLNEYSYTEGRRENPGKARRRSREHTFMGYRRSTGAAGIRNELWVVPTVGCINGPAREIVSRFREEVKPEGIDDVIALVHPYGCSQLGRDHINTRTILADIIRHPNAGGVLVLGLGCENNCVSALKKAMPGYDRERTVFLIGQEVEDEVTVGVALLKKLYEKMREDAREEMALSELKIGLKCGGSDGFSGITANPLLGKLSDLIVACGGTAVLTEVPEMFGAETVLMERAGNRKVFEKIVRMINGTKQFYMDSGLPVYENPSPGNMAGGITTLEEKSLGCVQKSGNAAVENVITYGEMIEDRGLLLLDSVANDSVSSTALGASGCQMVLFTTGRGTPLGSFIPTVKVASNTTVFETKNKWFDFNAGTLLEDKSMDELVSDFLNYILRVAGGERTANERNGYKEISIFKSGITL